MAHRRTLLDKNLLYVFSEDGNIQEGREDIGFVPGGIRINIHSRPQDSRVYHVAGETRMQGETVLSGTLMWGGDWAFIREDDLEILLVRVVIRTDDGADVEVRYDGLFAPGPRCFRQVLTERPKLGSEQRPFEGTFFAAPRFFTGAPQYAWLNGRQCLAFGRVKFVESVAQQATFDVWMMD